LNSNFTVLASPTENTSCSLPNGSIDITVSPSGAYTFLWSNGATTEDLQNLAPGQYQITVTDQANCASTLNITIGNNVNIPVLSSFITPSSCGQTNGVIDLTITPSIGNTFLWSNGANTEDLNN